MLTNAKADFMPACEYDFAFGNQPLTARKTAVKAIRTFLFMQSADNADMVVYSKSGAMHIFDNRRKGYWKKYMLSNFAASRNISVM